jgi:hypothetical protein
LGAEIRRTVVQGQFRKKVQETPSQWKRAGHDGCTCHPSYYRKPEIGGSWFRPAWAKSETLSQKQGKKGLKAWVK